MPLAKDFRDFVRANAADLAIGASFGAIVSSLIDGGLRPMIDLVLERLDAFGPFVVVGNPNSVAVGLLALARAVGEASLNIGLFINAVVQFAIVAFVLFLVVKGINAIGNSKPRLRPLNQQLQQRKNFS
jgi:large conductance mechanosensitive channel